MRCATPACSRGLAAAGVAVVDHGDAEVALAAGSRASPTPRTSTAVVACAARRPSASHAALGCRRARAGAGRRLHGRSRHGGRAPARRGAAGAACISTCTATSTRPTASRDGALDWMGVAHMLGEEDATPELRDVRAAHAAARATTRSCSSRIAATRARRASSRRSSAVGSTTVPVAAVAADPAAAAGEALRGAAVLRPAGRAFRRRLHRLHGCAALGEHRAQHRPHAGRGVRRARGRSARFAREAL